MLILLGLMTIAAAMLSFLCFVGAAYGTVFRSTARRWEADGVPEGNPMALLVVASAKYRERLLSLALQSLTVAAMGYFVVSLLDRG